MSDTSSFWSVLRMFGTKKIEIWENSQVGVAELGIWKYENFSFSVQMWNIIYMISLVLCIGVIIRQIESDVGHVLIGNKLQFGKIP